MAILTCISHQTLSVVRSPSVDRNVGTAGATLPVVQEDGEGGSREESLRDDKFHSRSPTIPEKPPAVPPKDLLSGESKLPSIPNFNRLSMGLTSPAIAS